MAMHGNKNKKGMAKGGAMKKKGYAMGGKTAMKKKGYAAGGALKTPGAGQKGLKKLPKPVRNKMGYMAGGGKLMETRQEIKDRVSKKDPDLSKSQLSRAYNIARGMDPSGRLTDQDISRVVNVLRGMQKPR